MEISIIIPVYNVEKYLRECLESIVKQIKANIEVIAIDDGSKDSSGKICDEYAKKYDFIKVIHKENAGVSVARNCGLKEAKGKYIMFLDSDDVLTDGIIERVCEEIKSNDDMYTFAFEEIDEEGEKVDLSRKELKEGIYNKKEFLKEYYKKFRTFPWAVWQSVYKKSIIENNKLEFQIGIKIAEDTDFYMRYIEHIDNIKNITLSIIKYRVNRKGSAMQNMKIEKIMDVFAIYSKYFYGADKFYSKYFANLYIATFNYILKLQKEEDIKYAIKCIDSKIVRSATGLKMTIFKIVYVILGKDKTINILFKLKKS